MVDVSDARVVAILTRAPSSGGKTRLFGALASAPDSRLPTALLLDTVDGAAAPGVTRVVSVTPASACDEVAALLPPGVEAVAQAEGTLGDRMQGAFASLLEAGARAVLLLGSDIPEITPATVSAAFALLERDPDALVLGPADDGGYYLIAAARVPSVFEGITWGTSEVLVQTMSAAASSGQAVALVERLGDVDTPDDLDRVARRVPHSRTAAWVNKGRK
jgi:rSAM/selenodomain-associated transferase 1